MANKYVASNGDDTYDGTTPQFVSGTTGPWATLHYAVNYGNGGALGNANPLAPGDILYLVMHEEGASIGSTFDGTTYTDPVLLSVPGTNIAPITIVGANVAGEIDGTLGVFDATGLTGGGNAEAYRQKTPYYVFRNLKVLGDGSFPHQGFTLTDWNSTTYGPGSQSIWINCWVDNTLDTGFSAIAGEPLSACYINCLATNCGAYGFDTESAAITGSCFDAGVFYACVANGCTLSGFINFMLAINSIAIDNSVDGFSYSQMLINNTAYHNKDRGFHFSGECGVATNCLALDNGQASGVGYGIDNDAGVNRTHVIINNGFWSNEDGLYHAIRLVIPSTDIEPGADPCISSSNVELDRRKPSVIADLIDGAYPAEWETIGIESPTDIGALVLRKPANIRIS